MLRWVHWIHRRCRSTPAGTTARSRRYGARKQLTDSGRDAGGGAETIAWHLRDPIASRRRHRVPHPQPHKRTPLITAPRRGRPAQRVLAGRHHPLAIGRRPRGRDPQQHRRRLPAARRLTARTVFEAGDVVAELHQAIAPHGHPERMLIDKGAVSAGRLRGHGWSRSNQPTAPHRLGHRWNGTRPSVASRSATATCPRSTHFTCSSRWRV